MECQHFSSCFQKYRPFAFAYPIERISFYRTYVKVLNRKDTYLHKNAKLILFRMINTISVLIYSNKNWNSLHIVQTRSLSPKFNNKINYFEYLQPKTDCTTFGRRIFGLAAYATSNLRWEKKSFFISEVAAQVII